MMLHVWLTGSPVRWFRATVSIARCAATAATCGQLWYSDMATQVQRSLRDCAHGVLRYQIILGIQGSRCSRCGAGEAAAAAPAAAIRWRTGNEVRVGRQA
jgi:hypothetical protein